MEASPALREVIAAIEEAYPPYLAQPWDAVGLVCGDPDEPVRRVLVAVDASPHAAAAAAFVARLPLDPAVAVRLLGVAERPRYPVTTPSLAAGMVRQAIEQIVQERRTALERALDQAAAPFVAAHRKVERDVVVGHAVDEIVGAAARPDVGLVVVGARGLGALQRVWLGSVSEGVLRHADRPVLVVKTDAP
jgi:nucleotide-binding universal stress UspA family protein